MHREYLNNNAKLQKIFVWQIKNQKKSELNTKLALYVSKGDKLSPRDLKRLKRDFVPYGFTEEEIKEKFNKLKNSQENEEIGAVLEVELAKNIQKSFYRIHSNILFLLHSLLGYDLFVRIC